MPVLIVALVLAFVLAVIVLSFAVHVLFSPWLLLLALGVVVLVKFRPRSYRK
jgi:hypothetical protein